MLFELSLAAAYFTDPICKIFEAEPDDGWKPGGAVGLLTNVTEDPSGNANVLFEFQ